MYCTKRTSATSSYRGIAGPKQQPSLKLTSTRTLVLANTVKMSAIPPLEIQIFPPFRRNVFPSSDKVARVWMDAASLPLKNTTGVTFMWISIAKVYTVQKI